MSDTRFSNDEDGRIGFDCLRLRSIAGLLSLESAIPETDIELHGTVGAVCGMFYRKIKEEQAELTELQAKLAMLSEALKYHQEQTRPIDSSIKALSATEQDVSKWRREVEAKAIEECADSFHGGYFFDPETEPSSVERIDNVVANTLRDMAQKKRSEG